MSSETIVSFTADQIAVRNHRIGGSESEAHRDAGGPSWPSIRAASRCSSTIRARAHSSASADLVGNPNVKEDWYVNPKTGEQIDFVYFARTEGRFASSFDKEGEPSATLLLAQQDRLENWRLVQDLAGFK